MFSQEFGSYSMTRTAFSKRTIFRMRRTLRILRTRALLSQADGVAAVGPPLTKHSCPFVHSVSGLCNPQFDLDLKKFQSFVTSFLIAPWPLFSSWKIDSRRTFKLQQRIGPSVHVDLIGSQVIDRPGDTGNAVKPEVEYQIKGNAAKVHLFGMRLRSICCKTGITWRGHEIGVRKIHQCIWGGGANLLQSRARNILKKCRRKTELSVCKYKYSGCREIYSTRIRRL